MINGREIRVMIVDDSLIVRRLLEDSLRDVTGIRVVGTATNGLNALARLAELDPDVVTLDVEMPQLDGLATLRRLRAERPRLHVIMFSSLTGRAAATTLEALANGAADCVVKPSGGGMTATREAIRSTLVPKIEALCARPVSIGVAAAAPRRHAHPARLVAIGASTGGPAALDAVLAALPATLAAPVLVVQHVPPMFSRLLAERLAHRCALRVVEASRETELTPGCVWIAPGDHHLVVARHGTQRGARLDDAPPEGSCRPSVDVLFRSVAAACGETVLGVVLTGMGHDGLRGCEAIRTAGGRVIVQDAATSIVWGMPGAVARAGLADRIVPLSAVAGAIQAACQVELEVMRARG